MIVDDHPLYQRGLSSLLSTQPDLQLVATAGSAAEAMLCATASSPDVVLLDLRLPDVEGTDAVQNLSRLSPNLKIVIVSSHEGDAMVKRAMAAGARGYVSKNASAEELLSVIRSVQEGKRSFSTGIATKLLLTVGVPTLTPREVEIMEHVAAGFSNKEVGITLGMAEKTAKNHLTSIFAKLDASDRTQAVVIATVRGIIGQRSS